MTHGMEEEADVALDQLHHAINVHHGLLVPLTQVGTHLGVKVLQLTRAHTDGKHKLTTLIQRHAASFHRYHIVIPLGFADCSAGPGRTYQAPV